MIYIVWQCEVCGKKQIYGAYKPKKVKCKYCGISRLIIRKDKYIGKAYNIPIKAITQNYKKAREVLLQWKLS